MSRVVVADLTFNVLSPCALTKTGWQTILGKPKQSVIRKGSVKIPLKILDRGWWAVSDVKVKDDPVAMEVDALKRANKLSAKVEKEKASGESQLRHVVEKACEVERDLDDKECPCHRGVGSAETQKKETQQCRSALLIRPVSETSAVKETRSEVRNNKFWEISDGPLSYLVRSVCSAMDGDPGVVETQSEATTID
ncbi:unnamed protein product [Effrenium voratum]|uniref:Uncharacterized protein n=1 Tax=Effrenium voratum TaxID=2562239 RepID=A0AA36IEE2_9DINO|nr:unnamed protein product [Effrenium voratum]